MRTRYGRPAFQGCGYIGFGAACALATGLARYGGLSLWIVAALAVSGAITFFALAMATKIVTGAETLTYYHHQTNSPGGGIIALETSRALAAFPRCHHS